MWFQTFAVFVVMCWIFTWELLTGERARSFAMARRPVRGLG